MLGISNLFKYHKIALGFIVLSAIFYLAVAYDLVRTDLSKLFLLYSALFVFAYQLIKTSGFHFRLLVGAAITFRLLFLFALPNLSQDFYRFIWDGRLILESLNPYLYTPDYFISHQKFPIGQAQDLYNGMGSLGASHYTNYPPLNQLCFFIAALVSGKSILGSVISMRLIIIAADLGVLYFGKKLLERLKLPSNRIFWYILNPFIIIELTGNLHFEGVMIFFLIWSLYLLHCGKWKWAAFVFACSISVKLIPLMFLPLFFGYFMKHRPNTSFFQRFSKLMLFYTIIGFTVLMFFLPFFSMDFFTNYSKTIALWFGDFEFNASIYYIARAIGYEITGYNEIASITKVLPILSVLIILGFSFLKSNRNLPQLISAIVLVFTCYLFLSTTVHPWYIATLVMLCIFTNYKFPLLWSLVIVLSYLAYSNTSNTENLWVIGLEYLIVFAAFTWEVVIKKRPQGLSDKSVRL